MKEGFQNDGENTISFEDPFGDLGAGVLGVCRTTMSTAYNSDCEETFPRHAIDSDIVFNDAAELAPNMFGTHDQAADPGCTRHYDLRAVATHEIGHLLGLAHSEDPGSVMYFSLSNCDGSNGALTSDDEAGIRHIYCPIQPGIAFNGAEALDGATLYAPTGTGSQTAVRRWIYASPSGFLGIRPLASPQPCARPAPG